MDAALIAGVGPGLGASLARAFASRGYAVALISRHAASSQPVADQILARGGRAIAIQADLSDPSQAAAAVERSRSTLGSLTALAYNASGYGRGPFLELQPETIRESFQVGVMGAVYVTQAVLPNMLRSGGGFISFTGATAALRGRAGFAPLAMAKASLRMLAQSLAREFQPQGIHVVHVIVDGQIDTPRLRARQKNRAAETFIPPDAIAEAILYLAQQPRAAWTHEIDIRPHVETF
ncbi:MAG TPA: SDR family NAD(P)-dependent oxidoreductase [Terriglobales bacterium]|nr:SDR family NAD(P)-dependent oxidoreductase [Terriglobales bacterium]